MNMLHSFWEFALSAKSAGIPGIPRTCINPHIVGSSADFVSWTYCSVAVVEVKVPLLP